MKVNPTGVAVSTALDTWPEEWLIDGDTSTVWSSYGHADHLADAEWATLLLPILYHRPHPHLSSRQWQGHRRLSQGLRAALLRKQQRSPCDPNDARFARPDNWYPLVSYAGYAQPDPSWLDFPFKAVQADCVRIFAVQLTEDGYGYRYLQLAEIEAYAGTHKIQPSGVAVSTV